MSREGGPAPKRDLSPFEDNVAVKAGFPGYGFGPSKKFAIMSPITCVPAYSGIVRMMKLDDAI